MYAKPNTGLAKAGAAAAALHRHEQAVKRTEHRTAVLRMVVAAKNKRRELRNAAALEMGEW